MYIRGRRDVGLCNTPKPHTTPSAISGVALAHCWELLYQVTRTLLWRRTADAVALRYVHGVRAQHNRWLIPHGDLLEIRPGRPVGRTALLHLVPTAFERLEAVVSQGRLGSEK